MRKLFPALFIASLFSPCAPSLSLPGQLTFGIPVTYNMEQQIRAGVLSQHVAS